MPPVAGLLRRSTCAWLVCMKLPFLTKSFSYPRLLCSRIEESSSAKRPSAPAYKGQLVPDVMFRLQS